VGFWVPGELVPKGWAPSKGDIPGLTASFPAGVEGYPASNPAIPEQDGARQPAPTAAPNSPE
ncbi:MAG: hypothetical protein VW644_05650, partial [Alphaproteobacteria bacterium]